MTTTNTFAYAVTSRNPWAIMIYYSGKRFNLTTSDVYVDGCLKASRNAKELFPSYSDWLYSDKEVNEALCCGLLNNFEPFFAFINACYAERYLGKGLFNVEQINICHLPLYERILKITLMRCLSDIEKTPRRFKGYNFSAIHIVQSVFPMVKFILHNDILEKEFARFLNTAEDFTYHLLCQDQSVNRLFYEWILSSAANFDNIPKNMQSVLVSLLSDKAATLDTLKMWLKNYAALLDISYICDIGNKYVGEDLLKQYIDDCQLLGQTPKIGSNIARIMRNTHEQAENIRNARVNEVLRQVAKDERLYYEWGGYCIVVPDSAAAFKEEAKAQDNCLVTYNYARQVADDECFIVFVRDKQNPTQPLVTCEISPDGYIEQYYLRHNEEVRKDSPLYEFYNKYYEHLRRKFKE